VVLAGVNLYSFFQYQRFDWTRAHLFTIPASIRSDLSKLQGDTTIVVYQRHQSFGQLADKPDNYDSAAERKVVEKVKDLVEQFQVLGPKFKVEILDVQEDGFNNKLNELTKDAEELRKAINSAP